MKTQRLWARSLQNATAFVPLCLLCLLLASSAFAQQLPSSTSTPLGVEWGKWTSMTPGAFKVDNQEAVSQCRRSSVSNIDDPLTLEKCDLFASRLANQECLVEWVPDTLPSGVPLRFDIMNARIEGESRLTYYVEKTLGRSDRALICDLDDGVFAYWFTGDKGASCNNVAFAFVEPVQPAVVQQSVVPPQFVLPRSTVQQTGGVVRSSSGPILNSVFIPGCGWGSMCAQGVFIPNYPNFNPTGSSLQSRGRVMNVAPRP